MLRRCYLSDKCHLCVVHPVPTRNASTMGVCSNTLPSSIFSQQLLYHVLQITPRRSGGGVLKRTKLKTSPTEQSVKAAVSLPDILCPDSFQETLNNIVAHKQDQTAVSGDFHLTLGNKDLFEGSFLLRSRLTVPAPKKQNPLRVSYVAPNSFKDNRWSSGLDLPSTLLQWRGFKTERSITAELKRNPTMTTRIRDVLSKFQDIYYLINFRSHLHTISDPPPTKLNNPLAMAAAQTPSDGFNRILTQVDAVNAPDDQKNRLKLAFAEGYLAANSSDGGHRGGKTMKYLKVQYYLK